MTSPLKTAQGLTKMLETLVKSGSFDHVGHKVKILTGGNGSLTAVMKVDKEDGNSGGFLHGGMAAYLVDMLSSLALITHPKANSLGVSVNINMTYLKAMPVGHEVVIKASTDKVGARLAFLHVDILNKTTGELVAQGSHTKFVG